MTIEITNKCIKMDNNNTVQERKFRTENKNKQTNKHRLRLFLRIYFASYFCTHLLLINLEGHKLPFKARIT